MPAPHRARVIGTRHMAAAGQYLAAQAAFQILEAGGNAIDAGVAGGIALGVVQSEYVNVAGVAPIMIRMAETGEVITISGLGTWPKAADVDLFRNDYDGAIPSGILRTVVPAAPDAWITALSRYGTMTFAEVASAAIRFARDGFPVPSLMSEIITKAEDNYRRWPANAAVYLPNDRPPQPGEILIQADLAGTLQYMADQEGAAKGGREAGLTAARDAFYTGEIAAAIVRYHQENGGWLSAEDMAEFHVGIEPPVKGFLGDIEVYGCGPWCQGPLLPQTLNILDGVDLETFGHNSPAYIHHIVEAFKLAYADRHEYYGDPRFVDVPMEALLDGSYAAARRHMINPKAASTGMPPPGLPSELNRASIPGEATDTPDEPLDTSYICVVDRHGNVFSATPSDGSAEGPLIPGLGIVPSARGVQSWTDPSVPACMAPGKRPRLTPNPAIAIKEGRWVMPFGSPGNDVQPQAMLQVLLNIFLFDMTPQQAVEAPRFATFSYPRSSDPHSYSPGLLQVEDRIGKKTLESLRGLGHDAKPWQSWEWLAGAVCTIVSDTQTGTMEGASDPRRPTAVAGW
jgi:gamma-glutamyltranspeptidase / glutathione hydrolase